MDKFKYLYGLYIFIFAIFIVVLFLFLEQNFFKQKIIIASPLPHFLTFLKNNQVTTLNIWRPSISYAENQSVNIIKPEISARSALVYDLTIDKTLFEKNPRENLPMASLTKIMTAIIALENRKEDDKYGVAKEDLVGEESMGLSVGEVLSQQELLYGLILSSGNDAAEAIANNFDGGRGEFIKAMNNKAKTLGASNTNFTNPSGLEGDGKQYTTAYDLLVITRYAMQFPLFREVASTFDYHIPKTAEHKEYYLENETNLLTSYPGVVGVKTGYTNEAGLCLITYLDHHGHEIIGIILRSENRREEMKELLDYSLKSIGISPPPHG